MTANRLEDLRGVERADVHKNGVLAGHLTRDRDDVEFAYLTDYVAHGGAAVAGSLPVTGTPFRATAGAVPTFFAGLLPEGARLQAVVAGTRTSADDQLTLLLAVGGDAVGDVSVVPAGSPPVSIAPFVEPAPGMDLNDVFRRATSTESGEFERVALPGVQEKVSALMMSAPIRSAAGPAILKINPPAQPHLVRNEHFFLAMATACGLPAPQHELITDRNGVDGLLVARFDRVPVDGGWARLEQEDGCQLLDVYPAAKYRVKTEEVIRAAAAWVEAGAGSGRLAVRRLLELVAFSYAIGNGDLHGKNFSAQRSADGRRRVTPVYDVLCTQPYLSWRDPMALDLYGRANRLNRVHLSDAAARLGVGTRAVHTALDRIADTSPAWIDRVPEIGFAERESERLQRLIRGRIAELARP